MPTSLGFGPIKDDDELLDRVGSRSPQTTDGLEGLFASWTASIDEDERAAARRVGPLGLRRVDAGSDDDFALPRTRVVRVPRGRAVAVAGALALTLSGGGVAAALTQAQSDLVSRVIEKATLPISVAGVPRFVAQTASPTPTTGTVTAEAAMDLVAKAREAADKGEVQKAIGMMEVIRSLAPKDSAGQQITDQVDQLEQEITAPVVVADAPHKKAEVTTDSVGGETAVRTGSRTTSEAPAPATVASAPGGVAAATGGPTSGPTSQPPSSGHPAGTGTPSPADTKSPSGTESPTVGHTGGNQEPGIATTAPVTTAPGTKAPSSSSSASSGETEGAPSLTGSPTGSGASVSETRSSAPKSDGDAETASAATGPDEETDPSSAATG